jgi:hypothetical protein
MAFIFQDFYCSAWAFDNINTSVWLSGEFYAVEIKIFFLAVGRGDYGLGYSAGCRSGKLYLMHI